MHIADAAWQKVNTTTIWNCWHKASILPDLDITPIASHPSIPISTLVHSTACQEAPDPLVCAERQVVCALDALVKTGALQRGNVMDIEALLNPVGEVEPIEETSDEEIYSSVINTQENGECGKTAGCDDAGDDPNPTPPPLTPAEALQSVKAQRSRDITWSIYILANLIIAFPQFVTSLLIDTEGEPLIPYWHL